MFRSLILPTNIEPFDVAKQSDLYGSDSVQNRRRLVRTNGRAVFSHLWSCPCSTVQRRWISALMEKSIGMREKKNVPWLQEAKTINLLMTPINLFSEMTSASQVAISTVAPSDTTFTLHQKKRAPRQKYWPVFAVAEHSDFTAFHISSMAMKRIGSAIERAYCGWQPYIWNQI